MQTVTSADGTTIAYVRAGDRARPSSSRPACSTTTPRAPTSRPLLATTTPWSRTTGAAGAQRRHRAVRDRARDRGPRRADRRRGRRRARCSGSPPAATWRSRRPRPVCRITHLALYEPPFALGTLPARPRGPAGAAGGADRRRAARRRRRAVPDRGHRHARRAGRAVPAVADAGRRWSRSRRAWSTTRRSPRCSACRRAAMRAVDVPTVVITGAQTWPGLPESAAALAAPAPARPPRRGPRRCRPRHPPGGDRGGRAGPAGRITSGARRPPPGVTTCPARRARRPGTGTAPGRRARCRVPLVVPADTTWRNVRYPATLRSSSGLAGLYVGV